MSSKREPVDRDAFQEVIDRLARALGVSSNKQVAEALGLTASNVGERKTRGALPRRQIDALCDRVGLNPRWVYTGQGAQHAAARPPPLPGALAPPASVAGAGHSRVAREPHSPLEDQMSVMRLRGPYAPPIDDRLLVRAIEVVERALAARSVTLEPARRARLIGALYEMSVKTGLVNLDAVEPLLAAALCDPQGE